MWVGDGIETQSNTSRMCPAHTPGGDLAAQMCAADTVVESLGEASGDELMCRALVTVLGCHFEPRADTVREQGGQCRMPT